MGDTCLFVWVIPVFFGRNGKCLIAFFVWGGGVIPVLVCLGGCLC